MANLRLPSHRHLCALLLWAMLCSTLPAQLRIVTYNTATAQAEPGTQTARLPHAATVLEAMGLENVGGVARPIDVLLLQEQFSLELTTQSFVDLLNDLYDPVERTMYARSTVRGLASSDFGPFPGAGGRPALVYNTRMVELVSEAAFGTVGSGTAQPRQFLRYQLRPVGYDSSADFYAYNSHYRAGDNDDNDISRFNEAVTLRNNSDALGEGTHAIYAGDYNITSSFATMYQELTATGNGQAFDPINVSGAWHENQFISGTDIRHVHTQSPAATGEQIPGFAGSGMDDRFDFQLVTGEFLDGKGLSYLSGSYRAFGNNGTHTFNQSITTGTGAAPTVLNALLNNSDHLPVVADYQLPAKMNAMLASVPTNVPFGAQVPIDILVENIADVLVAHGADELDYTINVSGALTGGLSDVAFPLAGANTHQVFLDTSDWGFQTGVVSVQSTSQQAANSLFSFPVSFTVGGGGGGPVFGVVAQDTFDAHEKLLSFQQHPAPGAFTTVGDGFETYQVGVSSSIPFQLLDDSTTTNTADVQGIVNSETKLDRWFGVTDTVNDDNIPAESPGEMTATWVFDVAGVFDLELSIDMAAMGDFEATTVNADRFNWTYQFDDGPALPLFSSTINEEGSQDYTLADGDMFSLDDPVEITTTDGVTTTLSNLFQTLTSPLEGFGDTLTIELIALTDGGTEAYAFDNIIVRGTTFVGFEAADFNQDGTVDSLDLIAWQGSYGVDADADADGDGDSDGADFLIWQRQLGTSSSLGASSVSVPEPAGMASLLASGCMLLVHRRQARRGK